MFDCVSFRLPAGQRYGEFIRGEDNYDAVDYAAGGYPKGDLPDIAFGVRYASSGGLRVPAVDVSDTVHGFYNKG